MVFFHKLSQIKISRSTAISSYLENCTSSASVVVSYDTYDLDPNFSIKLIMAKSLIKRKKKKNKEIIKIFINK